MESNTQKSLNKNTRNGNTFRVTVGTKNNGMSMDYAQKIESPNGLNK